MEGTCMDTLYPDAQVSCKQHDTLLTGIQHHGTVGTECKQIDFPHLHMLCFCVADVSRSCAQDVNDKKRGKKGGRCCLRATT